MHEQLEGSVLQLYICAGKLIVEEAGGLVTDFDGNKIDIYSKRILSSNGFIHQKMIDVMKRI